MRLICSDMNFYPRSPCGVRLAGPSGPAFLYNYYPRSPCGERQQTVRLSGLLPDFYPRSPCGERRSTSLTFPGFGVISIHALLAESDGYYVIRFQRAYISIHALLAESDPDQPGGLVPARQFLSTLSLRRATWGG